jgi:hypothetical protein
MRAGSTFGKSWSTGRSRVPSERAVISKLPSRMRYQPGELSLDIGVCEKAPDAANTPKDAVTHSLNAADKRLGITCSKNADG